MLVNLAKSFTISIKIDQFVKQLITILPKSNMQFTTKESICKEDKDFPSHLLNIYINIKNIIQIK